METELNAVFRDFEVGDADDAVTKKKSPYPMSNESKFSFSKKKNYAPILWMGFSCLKARATSRRQFTILPLSSQIFLVLILPTSEVWKAKSTLEPSSGSEHGTPGLGIQRLNHQAIISLSLLQE